VKPSVPARQKIPAAIWVLGFVSLLMDVSSEMVHSLLPMFMVGVLGASTLTVGLIEGLAESTALIVKVFSGTLSDFLGRRKGLAVLGYALGACSKPLFALASSSGLVLGARLIDRVGKGIRGAPRDALVADTAPADLRGTAYGFFNLVSGAALLLASAIAGWLWDRHGAAATFYAGAAFCALALLALVGSQGRGKQKNA
jgi:MFS family permease